MDCLVANRRGNRLPRACRPNLIISEACKAILATGDVPGQCLAPKDLFNRRQETGKSVVNIFAENGIRLTCTPSARKDGWLCLKEWLRAIQVDGSSDIGITYKSKLKIFDSCVNLIMSMQQLKSDPFDPNDAATTPHDITHITDALRYFAASNIRPNQPVEDASQKVYTYHTLKMLGKSEKEIRRMILAGIQVVGIPAL